MGDLLGTAKDALASFYITNSSIWERNDEVVAFLPESRVPLEKPVSVFDSRTGAELEFYETPQVNPKHRNAGRFLHIMIENIAGTGIVRLDIKEAKKVKDSTKSISDELKLENEFYSVTIDTKTSSISSIYSKKAKKEIVRQDAVVGFNGYIYD